MMKLKHERMQDHEAEKAATPRPSDRTMITVCVSILRFCHATWMSRVCTDSDVGCVAIIEADRGSERMKRRGPQRPSLSAPYAPSIRGSMSRSCIETSYSVKVGQSSKPEMSTEVSLARHHHRGRLGCLTGASALTQHGGCGQEHDAMIGRKAVIWGLWLAVS
eukprot:1386444-Rhodomonas_salina.3